MVTRTGARRALESECREWSAVDGICRTLRGSDARLAVEAQIRNRDEDRRGVTAPKARREWTSLVG